MGFGGRGPADNPLRLPPRFRGSNARRHTPLLRPAWTEGPLTLRPRASSEPPRTRRRRPGPSPGTRVRRRVRRPLLTPKENGLTEERPFPRSPTPPFRRARGRGLFFWVSDDQALPAL